LVLTAITKEALLNPRKDTIGGPEKLVLMFRPDLTAKRMELKRVTELLCYQTCTMMHPLSIPPLHMACS
jgi:hypothetical protein